MKKRRRKYIFDNNGNYLGSVETADPYEKIAKGLWFISSGIIILLSLYYIIINLHQSAINIEDNISPIVAIIK